MFSVGIGRSQYYFHLFWATLYWWKDSGLVPDRDNLVTVTVPLLQFPNLWFVQFQTLFVLHIIFPRSNTILIIFQGPYQEVSMGQALTPEPIYQFSPNVSWLFSFKQILPEVCGVTQSWFLCFGFPSNLERKCLWGCLEPCNRHWSAFNSYCSHKMQLDMWGFGLLWSRRYNETNRGVMLSAPCQGHQVDGVCEYQLSCLNVTQ